LTWATPFLRQSSNGAILEHLTSKDIPSWGDWPMGTASGNVVYVLCLKFVTTAVCLALPLPTGSVGPCFVLGAIIGRLFGNLLYPFIDDVFNTAVKDVFVSRFALVGASAFVAGTMRSIAQVIVVFERTTLPELLLPLCASSLAAIFVGQLLTLGYVDTVITLKKLPSLSLLAMRSENSTVGDVMLDNFPVLPLSASAADIAAVRSAHPSWKDEVAVATGVPGATPEVWDARLEPLVLVGALRSFPLRGQYPVRDLMSNKLVPLQIPAHISLQSALSLFASLQKSIAFVTRDGCLAGVVTSSMLQNCATQM